MPRPWQPRAILVVIYTRVPKVMVAKEAKWSLAGSLQAACSRGDERVVNLLLDKDADVNAAGGYCGAALQAACEQGYQHIVEILLRDGADTKIQGGHYGNALQAACYRGNETVVEMLLAKDIKDNV
jgi:ankyrin repeat protein